MNLANCPDCVPIGGSSHSENGHIALGEYCAAGTNFSEAGASLTTIESVDVGVPLLSMHSARELCGVQDPAWLAQALTAFYAGADT